MTGLDATVYNEFTKAMRILCDIYNDISPKYHLDPSLEEIEKQAPIVAEQNFSITFNPLAFLMLVRKTLKERIDKKSKTFYVGLLHHGLQVPHMQELLLDPTFFDAFIELLKNKSVIEDKQDAFQQGLILSAIVYADKSWAREAIRQLKNYDSYKVFDGLMVDDVIVIVDKIISINYDLLYIATQKHFFNFLTDRLANGTKYELNVLLSQFRRLCERAPRHGYNGEFEYHSQLNQLLYHGLSCDISYDHLEELTRLGANVNFIPENEQPILIKTAKQGDLERLTFIVERLKANLTVAGDEETSVLISAIEAKSFETIDYLLQFDEVKSILNTTDKKGLAPLQWAAKVGDIKIFKQLLKAGAHDDNQMQPGASENVIHLAALYGHSVLMQSLMNSHGSLLHLKLVSPKIVRLDADYANLKSALDFAVYRMPSTKEDDAGKLKCLQYLLANGAIDYDQNAKNLASTLSFQKAKQLLNTFQPGFFYNVKYSLLTFTVLLIALSGLGAYAYFYKQIPFWENIQVVASTPGLLFGFLIAVSWLAFGVILDIIRSHLRSKCRKHILQHYYVKPGREQGNGLTQQKNLLVIEQTSK